MTWDELELETPRLLAFLKICGVDRKQAPAMLGRHLAPVLDMFARDRGPDRTVLYGGLVDEVRRDVELSRWRGFLTHFGWEQKAALFLMIGLDFSLKATAEIFRAEPSDLAARLERSTAAIKYDYDNILTFTRPTRRLN
jgi:hypothetical protein